MDAGSSDLVFPTLPSSASLFRIMLCFEILVTSYFFLVESETKRARRSCCRLLCPDGPAHTGCRRSWLVAPHVSSSLFVEWIEPSLIVLLSSDVACLAWSLSSPVSSFVFGAPVSVFLLSRVEPAPLLTNTACFAGRPPVCGLPRLQLWLPWPLAPVL